jgi:23S rRNA pseudouridine1911/1915/1917 synthase
MSKGAPLEVLYEDNHLLAVWKPAGLATMGASAGTETLFTRAKEYLRLRYAKPGNVYLGVVSRVDALVTGVVLLARTSKAASRLTEQFRGREVEKRYWALVEGLFEPAAGQLDQWIVHDDRAERMRIVGPTVEGAQHAQLSFRRLQAVRGGTLLEVELHTGRKHQIRVQLADRGHPILGDRKYGSRRPFPTGIALHARRLAFVHPVRGERIELVAHLPKAWADYGVND